MKYLLLVALLFLVACTTAGSTYEVTTPEGFVAKATTTSDSDEIMFRLEKTETATTVELYKLGTDTTAAFESRNRVTETISGTLENTVPLMLRTVPNL